MRSWGPFAGFVNGVIVAASLLVTTPAAATDYSGTLNSNTTWNSGDVVVITGNLTVASGITLTVNAGAVVQFRGNYSLNVQGVLDVNGTDAAPARFEPESAGATKGSWYGISIAAGGRGEIDGAVVSKSDGGVTFGAGGTTANFISHSTLRDNLSYGVEAISGVITIDACTFTTNGSGSSDTAAIYVGNGATATISNNVIVKNNGTGIYQYQGTATVTHNTLHGNGARGIHHEGGSLTLKNNIITGNTSGGIYNYSTGTLFSCSYNDVWGNGSNSSYDSSGSSFASNPLFVDAVNNDYNITHRSPCRKSGEAGTYMGARDFAGANTSGNLGWIWDPLTIPAGVFTVTGDLTITKGVTVTIDPGAELQFAATDAMQAAVHGGSASLVSLDVLGTLVADGTETQKIRFVPQSSTAAPGSWIGINALANSSVTLDNAVIEKASRGVQSAATTLLLTQSTLRNNQNAGAEIDGGSATIDACAFTANGTGASDSGGVYLNNGATTTVSNSLIYSNSGTGIYQYQGTATVTNNTIHGNSARGVHHEGGSLTLKNNIIARNTSNGIYNYSTGTLFSCSYNDVWKNGSNSSYDSSGKSFASNPLFVDATNRDFNLTHRSPCRKNGEGATHMGAIPWAGALTSGMLGWLWEAPPALSGTTVVTGDLTVPPGVRLTVAPGAIVQVAATDAMEAAVHTSYGTGVSIDVLGELVADGTASQKITFTAESPTATPGAWLSIHALAGATVTLDNVVIEKSMEGVDSAATSLSLTQSLLSGNQERGAYITAGTALIDACTITANGTGASDQGGIYTASAATTVTNSIIYGNSGTGLYQYQGTAAVTNNTIHGNSARGVHHEGGSLTVKNNLITNNTSSGIYNYSTGTLFSCANNDVWGNGSNSLYDSSGSSLSQDPRYVNTGDANFHLLDTSPSIDVGTDSGAPDHDRDNQPRPLLGKEVGTARTDMGAFEYNRTANKWPVADAGASRTVTKDVSVSFDGTSSYDPDGTVSAWAWTFGDGGAATGATPSHTFTTAGTFQVTLTVTDNSGATASTKISIHVNTRPTATAGPDKNAEIGESVYFSSAGSSDIDGTINTYHWTFGDGAMADGTSVSHRYTAAGAYTATLTVTDDDGAQNADTVQVTVAAPSDTAGPVIVHNPIANGQPSGQEVVVVATISDESAVAEAALYYRTTGTALYTQVAMHVVTGNQYAATIPAAAVTTLGVDYYLRAADNSTASNTTSLPVSAPATPYSFTVILVDTAPPTITHTPIADGQPAGSAVSVTADVADATGVAQVTLFYRATGGTTFASALMSNTSGDTYSAAIPASIVTTAGVDYYIHATDTAVPSHAGTAPALAPAEVYDFTVTPVDNAAPTIVHTEIADDVSEGTAVTVSATVTDTSDVAEVSLYYKSGGALVFTSLAMTTSGGDQYTAEIPAAAVLYPKVDYYISAKDQAATPNTGTLPASAPTTFYDFKVVREFNVQPGDVVITELMIDSTKAEPASEWIELYNTTAADIDITGWKMADYGSDQFEITGGPVVVPAHGYLVLGRSNDTSVNGGVEVDWVYPTMVLSNTTDEVALYAGSKLIDAVEYAKGADWPIRAGKAMSLDPGSLAADANDSETAWCSATDQLPGGDFGSPGAANPPCHAPDTTPPTIEHTKVAEGQPAGLDVAVSAVVTDESGVNEAACYYRTQGGTWQSVALLNNSGDLWQAVIPAAAVAEPGVEYYLRVVDGSSNGNVGLAPAAGDAGPYTFSVANAAVDTTGPVITHSALTDDHEVGVAVTVTALVTDSSGVAAVSLFYRGQGGSTYTEIAMAAGAGNTYTATIPAAAVQTPGIQYYLWAKDAAAAASVSYHPTTWDTAPISFAVVDSSDRTAPAITHTPQTGSVLEGTALAITTTVTDASGIGDVTLYYMGTQDSAFRALTMTAGASDTFTATIPASHVALPGVTYYLEAVDASPNQNSARSPADAPTQTHSVVVAPDTAIDKAAPAIADIAVETNPAYAGEPIAIAARVSDATGVGSVQLFFRMRDDTASFAGVDMALAEDGLWRAELPGELVFAGVLEYYLEAVDTAPLMNVARAPAAAPTALYVVVVEEAVAPPTDQPESDGCGCNGIVGVTGNLASALLLGCGLLLTSLLRRRR